MSVGLDSSQKSTLSLIVNSASRIREYFNSIISNIDSALNLKADKSIVDEHTTQLSQLELARFGFGDKFETVQTIFTGFGDKFE